ncbi:MAG: antibiotic biosynthesis monooxygenase [Dehalococcoidia bacterium]|jgi:heme-degrading monooxygenase HmoA|uniref:putative quinol monooxygenase n=1 Tax=Candidatus Amarobacter glycogenicus TaxID=3140699 RepID=UPI001DBD4E8F|nr:antibiotic biosynthesis monooxygenase [Dehalococcoidia bacterium]MBK6561016.1 antibiotic biosynthesis monooxygenase [Dehalococcoidia bacterium]MBK7125410.1 antibiotic biosynthesis monooxygenase [Dehalococcoidia bacterium]MBK7328824.1 antibiotic biosynthesis monooxygenase [Dehalococcoidia bacterium]MBK7725181.1 antibiotic biosynthesis monooxygenase [Dehalococcoidia bacterium]
MAVKVVIERRVLPGQERRVLEVLRALRVRCLDEPGYISGETLRDSEDPQNLVVISTWFGLGDWRRWHASRDRQDFETRIRQHLSAPERVRVLLEGLTEHHSGA